MLFAMREAVNKLYSDDETRWSLLMGSAQSGSEADYRLLLSELSVVIKRYLLSRIGEHDFVEDCVQESLMAIHRARHTYDPSRRFRPWLFAIVKHKPIDMLRSHRASQSTVEAGQAGLDHVAESLVDDASGQLLGCLTPEDRQAITITKLIGLTHAEAAGPCACPLHADCLYVRPGPRPHTAHATRYTGGCLLRRHMLVAYAAQKQANGLKGDGTI